VLHVSKHHSELTALFCLSVKATAQVCDHIIFVSKTLLKLSEFCL
jgi:hypothetical protein